MPFWSSANIQPKLAFKWWASFGTQSNEVRSYTLRSFQRPSFTINTSEYIWLNDVNFTPGLLTWNPIEITLTDGEDGKENNARNLYNMLKESGYSTRAEEQGAISNIQKSRSSSALGGQILFQQIDAQGITIETWKLINPFLEAVNFGQGNYSSEEIITLSLTIRYDYAHYERNLNRINFSFFNSLDQD